MLSGKSVYAYREQFDTDDCAFAEPSNNIMVTNPANGKTYISPNAETDESFMNRLERCKIEQRNLFFEEWEEFVMKPDVVY